VVSRRLRRGPPAVSSQEGGEAALAFSLRGGKRVPSLLSEEKGDIRCSPTFKKKGDALSNMRKRRKKKKGRKSRSRKNRREGLQDLSHQQKKKRELDEQRRKSRGSFGEAKEREEPAAILGKKPQGVRCQEELSVRGEETSIDRENTSDKKENYQSPAGKRFSLNTFKEPSSD